MSEQVFHQLLIVLVGWATTYFLRAFPFILFGGAKEPPAVLKKFGAVISPLVIAGLIVYSYAGLEWRVSAPYLAGALTVGIHLALRNSLVSILVGTALYMYLVA